MAKVTSKLQLTVPKAIADQYGIRPGDNLDWVPVGDVIRVIPQSLRNRVERRRSLEERVLLFRSMVERQKQREAAPDRADVSERPSQEHEIARGWRREDLYDRGRSR